MDVLIGIVTGSEVLINRDGTLPGRLCQAVITDPEDVQTIEMTGGSDEFHPPNGCRLLILEAGPDCKMVVGVDDGVAPIMEAGGKRVYSLNTDGSKVMAEMQLKPDGTALVKNDQASFTLMPDGTIIAGNGASSFTMSPGGAFTFHGTSSTFDHPVTMQKTLEVTEAVTAKSTMAVTGGLAANGGLAVTGASTMSGSVTAGGDVKAGGISVKTHVHPGVKAGPDMSGVPQ